MSVERIAIEAHVVILNTLRSLEHGRKRVKAAVLDRLAETLNRRCAVLYPAAPPLALTKCHFIVSRSATVSVALQAITLDRPDLLTRDFARVSPSLRWWISGNPERLPWSGLYDQRSLHKQIANFHNCFDLVGMEDPKIYVSPANSSVVMKTVTDIAHPETGATLRYSSFIEFDVAGTILRSMEATFDAGLVTTFLETGIAPPLRKGAREQ